MRLLFYESDLKPILAKHASKLLNFPVTPDDILDFDFEEDENGDVTAVAIEFEGTEAPAE